MARMKYVSGFSNPYEEARATLQGDELYNELGGDKTWSSYANNGSLDTLVGTINAAKSKMSIEDIHNLPNWEYYSPDKKMEQLAVSMFTDNEKVKDWDITKYDEQGNPQHTKESMTEREYYQKQLDEYAEYAKLQKKLKEEQEYKDQMKWYEKAVYNVSGFLNNMSLEFADYFRGIVNTVGTVFKGMWNIGNGYDWDSAWREAGQWDLIPSFGWKESLYEWERTHTDLIKVTGELTTAASIANLLGNTLGQVAFLAAFNAGAVAIGSKTVQGLNTTATYKTLTSAGTAMQKAGQVLYWGGMAGNNYRELCDDPALADVPTIYLATNSVLRAAGEYAISKGLANFWGATSRAKLMHNWTPRINKLGGTKRLLTDMLKDGVEEGLQELSGQFINTASYVLQSQFGGRTEGDFEHLSGFNFTTIRDAFAAGMLVTGLSAGLKIVSTNNLYKDEYKLDKQGDIVYNDKGEAIRKKYSKITSWDIVENIDSFVHNLNDAMTDTKLTNDEKEMVLQQAYKSMEMLSSFFGQIGTERANAAIAFIGELQNAQYTASLFEDYVARTQVDSTQDIRKKDFATVGQTKIVKQEDGTYKSVTIKPAPVKTEIDTAAKEVYQFKRNQILNQRLAVVTDTILELQEEFSKGAVVYDAKTYEAQKENIKKKLEKAKITKVKQTATKDKSLTDGLIPGTEEYKSAKAIEAIFGGNDADSVVVSEDGVKPVKIEKTVVVPEKMLNSSGETNIVNDVAKSLAVEDVLSRIAVAPELKPALNELVSLYRRFSNNANAKLDEALANLFVDNGFFGMALLSGSKFVTPFLMQLDVIVDIASGNQLQTDIYKQQIANCKKQWQRAIVEYLLIQNNADATLTNMLTKAQQDYVSSHRYNKNMANRILEGKPTPADKSVVEKRVNALTISSKQKQTVLNNLYDADKSVRTSAINYLNQRYFGMFRSLLDNKTYPTSDTPPSYKLTKVLMNNDVTLETWMTQPIPNEKPGEFKDVLKQRKDYYNEQFKQMNNNEYELVIKDDGSYTIRERNAAAYLGGEQYLSKTEDVIKGKLADKAITGLVKAEKNLYDDYMSDKISDIGKQYYTVTDLIADPALLSTDTQKKILDKFGKVNDYTTFQYIRDDVLTRTGATSLVRTNTGDYAFVNVKPFNSILAKNDVTLGDAPDITKLIKTKYQTGLLKNTKIVYDKNTYYDTNTNTIHLDEAVKTNPAYARFALLHEIQHVIQYQNNITGGLSDNWLVKLPAKQRNQIVKDIRLHNADLFTSDLTVQEELELAQDLVYFQVTGEQEAYGLLGNAIVNRAPYFVRRDAKGVHLDTTWATYDLLSEAQSAKKPEDIDEQLSIFDNVEQPKMSRYVSDTEARGTLLENFIRKGKQIQMDPRLQEMLKSVPNKDIGLVDDGLLRYINGDEKATLNIPNLYKYIRTTTTMNKYTWDLINKYFFKNENIHSFEELTQLADIAGPEMYALAPAIKASKIIDDKWLNAKLTPKKVAALSKQITTDENLETEKQIYKSILNRYTTYKSNQVELDYGYARMLFAQKWTGSLKSGAKIAGIIKWIARVEAETGMKYGPKKPKTVSTQSEVRDTDNVTLEDTLEDASSTKAFDDMLDGVSEEEKIKEVKEYLYRTEVFDKALKEHLSKYAINRQLAAIQERIDMMRSYEIDDLYVMSQINDLTGKQIYEKAIQKGVKKVRPRSFIYTNAKAIGRTIASNIKPKDIAAFQEQFPGVLTNDGKFDTDYLKGKTTEQLAEAEDKLKTIRSIVKEKNFNVKQAVTLLEKLQKEKAKNAAQKAQVERLKKQKAKYKSVYTTNLGNDVTFDIYSDIDMPAKLKGILTTGFKNATELSQSEVQNVSDDKDVNLVVRGEKFIEVNAENLTSLSQVEAEEIANFYIHSTAVQGDITRNELRNYDAYKTLVLGFLLQQNRNGIYNFSPELVSQIKRTINLVTSSGATVTSMAKIVAKLTDPNKVLVESLKRSGIEIEEEHLDALVDALNLPVKQRQPGYGYSDIELQERKMKAIEEAIAVIANEARFQRKHSNKKSFFDQLWKIQRWAMLSSPGTALRNMTSNIVVDKLGKASEKVGRAVTKMIPRRKEIGELETKYQQYQIVGTKVSEDTKNFVNAMFNDPIYTKLEKGGKTTNITFYDLLNDGMSKYFADNPLSRVFKSDPNDMRTASQAMARSIIVKLFGEEMFNTYGMKNAAAKTAATVMNQVASFTFKWLSDDKWIRKETMRLFGAMLTEDNIDLSEGYSTKVLDTLANAYSMAAYEYMHRDNIATKIESLVYNKLGSAGYFAYKQLFPFLTSSINWFNEALNYSPIGLAKGIINYAKMENTIRKMEVKQLKAKEEGRSELSPRFAKYLATKQIGQGIIGSVGFIAGIILASVGLAGLDEKDDKYKLRIGTNFWIDISDLVGSSGLLAGIAARSIFEEDDASFWDVAKGTMNTLFDDSVYNGVISDLKYTDNLTDFFVNKTENALLSFIPNALKLFNKTLYAHTPQYSKNGALKFLQRAMVQMIPGAVYALPKKVDIYTGKTASEYNLPWLFEWGAKTLNSVMPIDISPYNPSDVEQEALFQGVRRSYLTGNYGDIGKLDSKDTVKLNKKYGELNNNSLKELFESKKKYRVQKEDGSYVELVYNKMTTEQKKSVIQRIMSDNATIAKIYIYTSNGGKYYTSEEERKELRKLGITNVYIKTAKKKGFA